MPNDELLKEITEQEYKYGFVAPIEQEFAPKGLNEDIIRFIWEKKKEPPFMLEWRLKAFRYWKSMQEPHWAKVEYPPIDYQDIYYYAAPKKLKEKPKSLDEVDPEILRTFEKLGIPLREQEILAGVAVDAVLDSVPLQLLLKRS
jgi:Iron-regulated ABC transporter membrane component SufB